MQLNADLPFGHHEVAVQPKEEQEETTQAIEESIKPKKRKRKHYNLDGVENIEGPDRRKVLNKLYAKKSRSKKKQYMQKLEEENKALKIKLKEYRAIVEGADQKKTLECISRISTLKELIEGKDEFFRLLEYRIKQKNTKQLLSLLMHISERFSIQANEKTKFFDLYISNFVDTMIPACYKYIIYESKQKIGMFDENSKKKVLISAVDGEDIYIPDEQIPNISFLKECIDNSRKKIGTLLENFIRAKNNLTKECAELESIVIENILKSVDPISAAKYICYVEKYKLTNDNLKEEVLFDLPKDLYVSTVPNIKTKSKK